jgi:hypothetical protein
VVRVLSIQVGASDLASVTVGKDVPDPNGQRRSCKRERGRFLYRAAGQQLEFWFANGGSVVVDARSGNTITLRVVNATMQAQNNAGSTTQPTGTFTINAAGQFTPQ